MVLVNNSVNICNFVSFYLFFSLLVNELSIQKNLNVWNLFPGSFAVREIASV